MLTANLISNTVLLSDAGAVETQGGCRTVDRRQKKRRVPASDGTGTGTQNRPAGTAGLFGRETGIMDSKSYYTAAKVAELEAAFANVQPADNWKNPIDVEIEASIAEIGRVKEAITFYTGSIARASIVRPVFGTELFRVRIVAAGYYAAIGS
jgi:hypothetical protein